VEFVLLVTEENHVNKNHVIGTDSSSARSVEFVFFSFSVWESHSFHVLQPIWSYISVLITCMGPEYCYDDGWFPFYFDFASDSFCSKNTATKPRGIRSAASTWVAVVTRVKNYVYEEGSGLEPLLSATQMYRLSCNRTASISPTPPLPLSRSLSFTLPLPAYVVFSSWREWKFDANEAK
jgi:hypothetical protein